MTSWFSRLEAEKQLSGSVPLGVIIYLAYHSLVELTNPQSQCCSLQLGFKLSRNSRSYESVSCYLSKEA